jgi:hypothetical protein
VVCEAVGLHHLYRGCMGVPGVGLWSQLLSSFVAPAPLFVHAGVCMHAFVVPAPLFVHAGVCMHAFVVPAPLFVHAGVCMHCLSLASCVGVWLGVGVWQVTCTQAGHPFPGRLYALKMLYNHDASSSNGILARSEVGATRGRFVPERWCFAAAHSLPLTAHTHVSSDRAWLSSEAVVGS